jgi:hypothetical protein
MRSSTGSTDCTPRLLAELESLTRDMESALGARDWAALDRISERTSLLVQGIADLAASGTMDVRSSKHRERSRAIIERHGRCFDELRIALHALRRDRHELDQLQARATAVLPRYHDPRASESPGRHLAGAA